MTAPKKHPRVTPRRAPTTPPPVGGPTVPPRPPAPQGSPRQPATVTAAEEAGEAAAHAVRTLPQSPTAAAFGAAQQLVGAGRAAARRGKVPRRGELERALTRAHRIGPDLVIERGLYLTGTSRPEPPLMVNPRGAPRRRSRG